MNKNTNFRVLVGFSPHENFGLYGIFTHHGICYCRICTSEMLGQPDHIAVLLDVLAADNLTGAE